MSPSPETKRPLILASGSPRRRDLLENAGISFEIEPADIPEQHAPGETPVPFATRLAREKALTVAKRVGPVPRRFVLGGDTIVVLDEELLGKPRNAAHAEQLLGRLVGRRHCVVTAMAVAASDDLVVNDIAVTSFVTMREASVDEIRAYVATGEPLDKAGAYAVQGLGRRFIESIEGSETNVIGLPVEETLLLLERAGARVTRS